MIMSHCLRIFSSNLIPPPPPPQQKMKGQHICLSNPCFNKFCKEKLIFFLSFVRDIFFFPRKWEQGVSFDQKIHFQVNYQTTPVIEFLWNDLFIMNEFIMRTYVFPIT